MREATSMPTHFFISLMNAKPGRDQEYEDWYGKEHLPDVLQIPGFVAAQRFKISEAQLPGMTPRWKYLVIYEIAGVSPAAALAELGRRIGSDMAISDALAPDVAAWAFTSDESRRTAR